MPVALLGSRRAWLQGLAAGGVGLALVGGIGRLSWQVRPARTSAAFDPAGEVCVVAPLQPWSAQSGLAIDAPRPVPADARCPLCGMYPARAPEWAAQAIFDDGATQFFDSPVNLRLYLREVGRHARGRSAAQLIALYVTDAAAGAGHWLDATQAWYVRGSRALGPMRNGNLPAFASREAAEAFSVRRGGAVLAWHELQGPWLDQLDARHVHRD